MAETDFSFLLFLETNKLKIPVPALTTISCIILGPQWPGLLNHIHLPEGPVSQHGQLGAEGVSVYLDGDTVYFGEFLFSVSPILCPYNMQSTSQQPPKI